MLYRHSREGLQVLLGHMGGPYFAGKDDGAWTIPKGEYEPDEQPFAAACREFEEEFGSPPPTGPGNAVRHDLGTVRQRSGKLVTAWAVEAEFDADGIVSNTFEIEWPPRSGRRQSFPEIDRAAWFGLDAARDKLVAGQGALLDALVERLDDQRR
jgi:predicted NUDIX family NTP pyrophosphohydrolase